MITSIVSALLGTAGLTRALVPEFDASCANALLSTNMALVNQTYVLPDPFTFADGRQVTTMADWNCRAGQIRDLFQEYELGWKPPRPPVLLATVESNNVTITAGIDGKTINFTVPISYPNISNPGGLGPIPAIITYQPLLLPRPDNVAVITLDVGQIAQQNNAKSRGIGLFYDLYGKNASTGALMAWAWATSRIIDTLEALPQLRIDPTSVAITGCSRNGKGAMVAGAFDSRIALTIPQESGSGGDACWRMSRDILVNDGMMTQTAWEIVDENVWFSPSFEPFAADNYTVGMLPVDHHQLAGLIAPRGLYSTSNVGFLWLGGSSCFDCMVSANKIYQALGAPDNHGFSQNGPHGHCATPFPEDQQAEIQAFYDKFLFGKQANTAVLRTAGNWTFDASWVPWSVPRLQ